MLFQGKNTYTAKHLVKNKIVGVYGKVRLSDIKYCQNSISSVFRDGRSLEEGVDDIIVGRWIPKLRVVVIKERFWSLDNRRLWCAKKAGIRFVNCEIVKKGLEFLWKFSTRTNGKEIHVNYQEFKKCFCSECKRIYRLASSAYEM